MLGARGGIGRTSHDSLLSKRDTPKLNGSGSAFIALVIVLTIIILIACVAAIYLLWESSNKADRHSRIRRYQASGQNTSSTKSPWFARLFRPRVAGPSSARAALPKKTTIRGWIQSVEREASRDVLATIEEQPEAEHSKIVPAEKQMSEIGSSLSMSTVSVLDQVHRSSQPTPIARYRTPSFLSDRSTSVSFVSSLPTHHESYTPRAQHSIPSIVEHLTTGHSSPSASPSPLGSPSAELLEAVYPNGKGRPFATRSGTSMTFDGGTKFVEEL